MTNPTTEMRETSWPWPALRSELDPESTALVVVNAQRQFVDPEYGEIALLQQIAPDAARYRLERWRETVWPNCQRLVRYFRENGLRVIHLTTGPELPNHGDLSEVVRLRNAARAEIAGRPVIHPKGSPGHAILDEIAPLPNEPVINKLSENGFNSSNLDNILRNLGIESTVLVGVTTDGSVDSTARGASDLGYQCIFVDDATVCDDPFLHRQTLRSYVTIHGRAQSTAGVIAELSGDSATAETERDATEARLLTPETIPGEQASGGVPYPPMTFSLPENRTALLVVDMQYFCHPDHGMGAAMESVKSGYTGYKRESFHRTLHNCVRLLEAFRRQGKPVLFLTMGPELADRTTPPLPMHRRNEQRAAYANRQVAFPIGTFEHGIVEELTPLENEAVVNKLTASAFRSSKLDQVLRNMGIEGLVVAGVATNACVEGTVRDAADRGYRCLLVDDACAAYDPAFQEMTMRTFRNFFGRVVMTDEALAEVFGSVAEPVASGVSD